MFFTQLILRYARRHRLVAVLNVLTIALGVAVYLAIQITNHSAFQAFNASIDIVAGKSHLEVRAAEGDVDAALLATLTAFPGVKAATPVSEGYATLPERPGEYLHLLGVDPATNGDFQTAPLVIDDRGASGAALLLAQGRTIAISRELADEFSVEAGATLAAQIDGRQVNLLIGFVYQGGVEITSPRVASMSVGGFQQLFQTAGKVSSIQLILDDPTAIEAMRDRIAAALPPGVQVAAPGQRSLQIQRMVEGFRLNITALSMVSILVGIFLIYNTVAASVVRRRREIGILRSIGASRTQIRWLFLGEALFFGLIGTALGLVGGFFLSSALLGEVAETISLHYILVRIDESFVSPLHVGQAAAYGIFASLLGAWMPAWEATKVDPARVMHPGRAFESSTMRKEALFAVGAALLLLCGGAAWQALRTGPAWMSFASCFFLLAAFSLMAPLLSFAMAAGFKRLCALTEATLQRLAGDNYQRSLHRTATTVAALMASVAMMIGVSVMISSFRNTIDQWVGRAMVADIYVGPAANEIIGIQAFMPEDVRAFADSLPETERTETYLESKVLLDDGQRYALAVVEGASQGNIAFVDADTDPAEYLQPDRILISENFARRYGAAKGDTLRLPTPEGTRPFRIAGVFYDYTDDFGRIYITRENYDRYWNEPRYQSIALHLKPEAKAKAGEIVARIREKFGRQGEFSLFTNASIRAKIFDVFDQTFAITYVLRTIAIIVAVIGIILTLTTLVTERSREIGVLRALGADRRQICATYLTEASLIGFFSSALGLACGLLLAMLLTWVVNQAFFNWTIRFQIPWREVLPIPVWVTAVGFLAGIWPALRAAGRPIADAVRAE